MKQKVGNESVDKCVVVGYNDNMGASAKFMEERKRGLDPELLRCLFKSLIKGGGFVSNPSSSHNTMGKTSSSSSSSFSSNINGHAAFSTASSLEHLPTDLRLGLSISPTPNLHSCTSRGEPSEKRTLESSGSHEAEVNGRSLFVKVHMEGIPIGRKLDLLAQDGYNELIKTLEDMFDTTITLGSEMEEVLLQPAERWHVLTYEDEEGDLIMVGDIPWEMFLSSVRRLRITRVDAIGC